MQSDKLYENAVILQQCGKLLEAAGYCHVLLHSQSPSAIEMATKSLVSIYTVIGIETCNGGRDNDALMYFKAAYAVDCSHPDARNNLAHISHKIGQQQVACGNTKDGIELLELAISVAQDCDYIHADLATAYEMHSVYLQEKTDFQGAIDSLEKAINVGEKTNPRKQRLAGLYAQSAIKLYENKSPILALDYARRSLTMEAGRDDVKRLLAAMLTEQGMSEVAINGFTRDAFNLFSEAYHFYQDNVTALNFIEANLRMAGVLCDQNCFEAAYEILKFTLMLFSDNVIVRDSLLKCMMLLIQKTVQEGLYSDVLQYVSDISIIIQDSGNICSTLMYLYTSYVQNRPQNKKEVNNYIPGCGTNQFASMLIDFALLAIRHNNTALASSLFDYSAGICGDDLMVSRCVQELLNIAKEAFWKNSYNEASVLFEKAYNLGRGNADLYCYFVFSKLKCKDFGEGLSVAVNKIICQLDKIKDITAVIDVFIALRELRQFDEAKLLANAILIYAKDYRVYVNTAVMYEQMGDFAHALTNLKKATSLVASVDQQTMRTLVRYELAIGKVKGARTVVEFLKYIYNSCEVDANIGAMVELMDMQLAVGNKREALRLFNIISEKRRTIKVDRGTAHDDRLNVLRTSFDKIISLGATCDVAAAIKSTNYAQHSPFDWLISPHNALIESLSDKFLGFNGAANLIPRGNRMQCGRYGLYYVHDFPRKNGIQIINDNTKKAAMAKLAHKATEFLAALRKYKRILFVRYEDASVYANDKHRIDVNASANEIVQSIMNINPTLDFMVLYLYRRHLASSNISEPLSSRVISIGVSCDANITTFINAAVSKIDGIDIYTVPGLGLQYDALSACQNIKKVPISYIESIINDLEEEGNGYVTFLMCLSLLINKPHFSPVRVKGLLAMALMRQYYISPVLARVIAKIIHSLICFVRLFVRS